MLYKAEHLFSSVVTTFYATAAEAVSLFFLFHEKKQQRTEKKTAETNSRRGGYNLTKTYRFPPFSFLHDSIKTSSTVNDLFQAHDRFSGGKLTAAQQHN
jgi:hypothetical protein